MTADALSIVKFIFSVGWQFFSSWYIPGTNVTPAAMGFFLLAAAAVIKIVKTQFFEGGDE